MKVYKVYIKIVLKNIVVICSFIVLFLGISFLFEIQAQKSDAGQTNEIIFISVQNHDIDSPFSDGLKYYLDENARLVRLIEKRDNLKDALFFGKVDYILTIPEGFYESLSKGDPIALEKSVAQNSYANVYGDMLVSRYLDAWKNCTKKYPERKAEEIRALTAEALSWKTEEISYSRPESANWLNQAAVYFNGISYAVIGAVISVIVIVTEAFFNQDVGRRNLVSPMPVMELYKKISLGNFIMGLIVWAVSVLIGVILFRNSFLHVNILLMSFNLLIFIVSIIGLGSFISKVSFSRSFIYGIANGIALFMCIVSGAFAGQNSLNEEMKSLAAFLPAYWYIKANESLKGLEAVTLSAVFPVLTCFGIELGFAVAFFSLGLLVEKEKIEIELENGTSQKFP